MDELTPRQLAEEMKAGKPWQLLDVREDWEIRTASVPAAIHIPMGEIPERHRDLDECRPVAVICHSGVRSAQVARFLKASGFPIVANVSGGIDAWSREVDETVPRY